jgi:hypothetical protein
MSTLTRLPTLVGCLVAVAVTAQLPAGVAQPTSYPASLGVAAILNQPDLPASCARSLPQTIAAVLRAAGLQTHLVSADELADPNVFNMSRFDLLVLPDGPTFPAAARPATIAFLRNGGSFLSMGGYAFNHLVRKVDGRWLDELQFAQRQIADALRPGRSLLRDGGFEQSDPPIGGSARDGAWRRSTPRCLLAIDGAKEGRRCAQVSVSGDVFLSEVPCQPGRTYRITGWMRTRAVTGSGMAFMAVYEHDAAGELVEFRDFAIARGTTNWQQFTYDFTPPPQSKRLRIPLGLYEANGTAWFDDIRLGDITGLDYRPMNTATGKPADGLLVEPTQIGVFDASFPLKRACSIRTAPMQHVVSRAVELSGDFQGWAASGVIGNDNARWIPLLAAYDRFGRPRGAAGALVVNYDGLYSGSCWAYFGVANADLFRDPKSAAAQSLQDVARFIVRRTFLRNLKTDHRMYYPSEPVMVAVAVDNRGKRPERGEVTVTLQRTDAPAPPLRASKPLLIGPARTEVQEFHFAAPELWNYDGESTMGNTSPPSKLPSPKAGLWRVTAELQLDGRPVDQVTTGFITERPGEMSSGPVLRFKENYFTLDGRPQFLFGSDTYDSIYHSASENPLTWAAELTAARDMGVDVYENLQYTKPGHVFDEDDWRSFRALAQLTQQQRLVFMPGMLIGHNVAVGDRELVEQRALCGQYARRFCDVPGLLYYINGDYQLNAAEQPGNTQLLWNRWLAERYGTAQHLRAAWGDDAVRGDFGQIKFPPPDSGHWDDAAALDKSRFENWLVLRWNQAHVAAVREHDRDRPITSEYYQVPIGGIDMVRTIDGQDMSNFGFFDRPGADLDNLPLQILGNDLRLRGKGVGLGEYGVKTHPAWAVANGGSQYHIQRTEEEQRQLFTIVAHYALGLGACKVQNWCLRDAQASVFPWGIFYPNELVPKDIAYVHRNLSLVWRHFTPVYRPPALAVCLASQLRIGNQAAAGPAVAYRTFADLLALHFEFAVIDDEHLDLLPASVTTMILPSPFAMRDQAFQRLLGWVRGGGTLLVTGDFSYDAQRRRTASVRVKELAGVEFVAENYPNVERGRGSDANTEFSLPGLVAQRTRPCVRLRPKSAEVLGKTTDGLTVLVRNAVGGGQVYYFVDPAELDDTEPSRLLRRGLYGAFLRAASIGPRAVEPDAQWLHVLAQPVAEGMVHVVVNTKIGAGAERVNLPTAAGPIRLTVRNRWSAMVAVSRDGKAIAVGADATAAVGAEPLMDGAGQKVLLSLDGEDVRRSVSLVIVPMEPGQVRLPRQSSDRVAVVGEYSEGRWVTYERLPLDAGRPTIDIDADRATCLILVCQRTDEPRCVRLLNERIRRRT